MVLEAELKIVSACFGVEELRIAAAKSERYVGEDCEGSEDAAEEDKRDGDDGFLLGKGLIFGGKNFNIAPISCFPSTRRVGTERFAPDCR